MVLRVISLDFDGCIFNRTYHTSNDKQVILHNKSFLDALLKDSQKFTNTITMIGSSRQSKNHDIRGSNQNHTASCFFAIRQITHYLNATFAPLLLADIFGDLPDGTSYTRLMDASLQAEKHHAHIHDESKLTLLYAQIHHIAQAYPDEQIVFNFYDDNNTILNDLNSFFNRFPVMIPKKTTLCLHQYTGNQVSSTHRIAGTGKADLNYRQTIIDMIELTGHDLCTMTIAQAFESGFARSYIWDGNELSYISIQGDIQRNISVKDTRVFSIFNKLAARGVNKLRLNQETIDHLLTTSALEFTANDIKFGINRKCTDEITPELLLLRHQTTVRTATGIHLHTRKTINLQLEIVEEETVTEQNCADLHINDTSATANAFINIPIMTLSQKQSNRSEMNVVVKEQSSSLMRWCCPGMPFFFFNSTLKKDTQRISLLSASMTHEQMNR